MTAIDWLLAGRKKSEAGRSGHGKVKQTEANAGLERESSARIEWIDSLRRSRASSPGGEETEKKGK
jgi:hypothetical protein